DPWLLLTQRRGKRSGGFGQFRAIPQEASNRKRWRWPPRPGPANSGGDSVEEMSGTRSLTIRQPAFYSSALLAPESAKARTPTTTPRAVTNCFRDALSQ